MKLLIEQNMSRLIKLFFVSGKTENGGFQLIPTIVVLLLALSFQGAIVYIMVSSLLQH
jgi:hypothetical protein